MAVIIGLDPGSRITGYGVIESTGNRNRYITSGCIRIKATDFAQRLEQIFSGLRDILAEYQPDEAAIEQVFMHQNPNVAIKLGQARGAAITALAIHPMPVAEYSARQIKQSVVGYGNAAKDQVQHMVCRLLNLSDTPQVDAADGLAVALCHSHMRQGLKGMTGANRISRGRLK